MRILNLRSVRSLLLAVLIVAVIAGGTVLRWRSMHFLELSRYFRAQAATYAQAESRYMDAFARVADLERAVASAEPPSARADGGAWSAYREYLSDLRGQIKDANAALDVYGGYVAQRRRCEQLAAQFKRAAMTPWIGVAAEAPGTK